MAAELQCLQAGEERRGSQCLENRCLLFGGTVTKGCRIGNEWSGGLVPKSRREMGAAQGQVPGREEGRRNSEDEQEQGRISQQLVLPAPGGINEGTPASSLELYLLCVRGALGDCGGPGKTSTLGDRKRGLSNSPSRRPMEEDAPAGDLRVKM